MSNDTFRKAAALATTDPHGAYDMVLTAADDEDLVDKAVKLFKGVAHLDPDKVRAELARSKEAHFYIDVPGTYNLGFMGALHDWGPAGQGVGVMINSHAWAHNAGDLDKLSDFFGKLAKIARDIEK